MDMIRKEGTFDYRDGLLVMKIDGQDVRETFDSLILRMIGKRIRLTVETIEEPYYVQFVPEDGTWAVMDRQKGVPVCWTAHEITAHEMVDIMTSRLTGKPKVMISAQRSFKENTDQYRDRLTHV